MIRMYGTTENGDGYVMRLGDYESIDDVVIHACMFGPDVELTFVEIDDKDIVGPHGIDKMRMTSGEK